MKRAISWVFLITIFSVLWAGKSSLAWKVSPYSAENRRCLLRVVNDSDEALIPVLEAQREITCSPDRSRFELRKTFDNFYGTGEESWDLRLSYDAATDAGMELKLQPTDPGEASPRAVRQVIPVHENPCLMLERGGPVSMKVLGGSFIDGSQFTVEMSCGTQV